jgi:hypothetical protein
MADYMVDVRLVVRVPVSAPNWKEAEALALRQLTVKLGKVATDDAVATAYEQGK